MTSEHVNMAHAREAHQRETMERIKADGVCPFCRENLERYHTEPILFETEHWVATLNFAPYPGAVHHFLLIARTHVVRPSELEREAWADLHEVQRRLEEAYTLPAATLIMRWGDSEHTGASVTHLHAQLVVGASRLESDGPITTTIGYRHR